VLSTHKNQTWLFDLIIIALCLGAFYALWIGSYPLFTPDEGRYSEVAREMILTGNYLTPHLNHVVFLDKPILYYWLQAAAIYLFGLTEWALRFWPAALGIFCCLITYITGRIAFNRRTGILSSFILATSFLYFGSAHYANLDLEVAVWVSNALFCFITAFELSEKRLRTGFLIAAYVFSALAFLTKGLIGVAFPIGIIGLWIIFLNRWRLLLNMRLALGLVLFSVIAMPWYFLVQKANPQFFHYFFMTQQFARFLTKADFNNQSVFWFYVPIIVLGFVPWTLFLFQALASHVREVWQDRQKYRKELFFLLWALFIFLFFSFPKSKTLGYILPVFPALAMIVGNYISTSWEKLNSLGIHVALVLFILLCEIGGAIVLAAPHFYYFDVNFSLSRYLTAMAIVLIVAGVIAYYFFRTQQCKKLIYLIFVSTGLFLLILMSSASVLNQKSIKHLALQLRAQIQPDDEVVTYQKYFQDLPIYIQRRITVVSDWHASCIPHNDNWQRELWFGMPYRDTSAWLIEEATFWQRWHSSKRLYVFMYTDYYPNFRYRAKNNVHEVAYFNDMVLVTNQVPT